MNEILIKRVNETNITIVQEGSDIFVPVHTITDALGVDFSSQRKRIMEDPILASTVVQKTTVGSDGKQRDMVCLPFEFVFGWLFTINPGKVAPEAREAVMRYRRECYEVLYEHFTASMARTIETNNAEIALLKELNGVIIDEKEAKAQRRKLEQSLQRLRTERLNPQPKLF